MLIKIREAKQLLQPCHTCANCCQVQVFSAWREALTSKAGELAEGGMSLSTGEQFSSNWQGKGHATRTTGREQGNEGEGEGFKLMRPLTNLRFRSN